MTLLGLTGNICLLFVSLLTRKRVYCYAWNYIGLLMDHIAVSISSAYQTELNMRQGECVQQSRDRDDDAVSFEQYIYT